jgi:hypothetical protein
MPAATSERIEIRTMTNVACIMFDLLGVPDVRAAAGS